MNEHESVVRRSLEAWNKNDWEGIEELWDPSGEIVAPEGWPESEGASGWPAIRAQFERIKDSWAEERVEPVSVEQIGDRVLAHLRWTMKGEASGAPLETELWMLAEFRGARLSRCVYFQDGAAAREAAQETEAP